MEILSHCIFIIVIFLCVDRLTQCNADFRLSNEADVTQDDCPPLVTIKNRKECDSVFDLVRENHTVILLAYIAGAQYQKATNGDHHPIIPYKRPGRYISGAASMALRKINSLSRVKGLRSPLPPGYQLDLDYFETYGKEACSIRRTADAIVSHQYAAIIGPQDSCHIEASIASSYNIPMISHFCEDRFVFAKRSDSFMTFIRSRPQPEDVASSVVSLLKKYNWSTVALVHSDDVDSQFTIDAVRDVLKQNGIVMNAVKSYRHPYLHNIARNQFMEIVEETYRQTRIYLMFGEPYEAIGLLDNLEKRGLLATGAYFVIIVDKRHYDGTTQMFTLSETEKISPLIHRALFRVTHSGPDKTLAKNISNENEFYLKRPPFYFPSDALSKPRKQFDIYTSYLYDAIFLYAKAAGEIIRSGNGSYSDGRLVASKLIGRDYVSMLGYNNSINKKGIAASVYTVVMHLPRSPRAPKSSAPSPGYYPIGFFKRVQPRSDRLIQDDGSGHSENEVEYNFELLKGVEIPWITGETPPAHPLCGFDGTACRNAEPSYAVHIAMAVVALMFVVFIIVAIFVYRNNRFEKELERLLWKISYSELAIPGSNEEKMHAMGAWEDRIQLDFSRTLSAEAIQYVGQSVPAHNNESIKVSEEVPLLQKVNDGNPFGSISASPISAMYTGTPIISHDVVAIVSNPTSAALSIKCSETQTNTSSPSQIKPSSRAYSQSMDLLYDVISSPALSSPTTSLNHLNQNVPAFVKAEGIEAITLPASEYFTPLLDNTDLIHCIYRKQSVVLKRIHKYHVHLNRKVKKDLKVLRELSHKNLTKFYGACVDPGHIFAVWEFCPRRSLQEILYKDRVNLDPMFISSLIFDILRGLTFLHESGDLRYHGNLTSSNCVVDSRWMCKLTDFGLYELRAGEIMDHLTEENYFSKFFWCAPEILRHLVLIPEDLRGILPSAVHWDSFREEILPQLQSNHHHHVSQYVAKADAVSLQRNDVFSFGIILYEMHAFQKPYADCSHSAKETIWRLVILNDIFKVPYRPKLSQVSRVEKYITDCIQLCWNEDPQQRPTVKTLPSHLKPMAVNRKLNIVDNMIDLMESYAKNLERLVNDRTEQLMEEKKRTEELLYQMLPVPVAEQLKRGKQVEAEAFDCVTIYFSDICGFTELSASSTPFQVVQLLNELYTSFDSVIASYDVYKVETIGDAYMVVSGLPNRNERHAVEIASMSVRLLQEVMSGFTIHYQHGNRLKLRIGLHSGPCVAGVVGFRMPRYCLFGDTVNTASRMESHGEPLKIHCSPQFKKQVDKHGGFVFRERGITDIKGKGPTVTYWLLGKTGEVTEDDDVFTKSAMDEMKETVSPVSSASLLESHPSFTQPPVKFRYSESERSSSIGPNASKKSSIEESHRSNPSATNTSELTRQLAKLVNGPREFVTQPSKNEKRRKSSKALKQNRRPSSSSLGMNFAEPFNALQVSKSEVPIELLPPPNQPTSLKKHLRRGHIAV